MNLHQMTRNDMALMRLRVDLLGAAKILDGEALDELAKLIDEVREVIAAERKRPRS